MSKNKKGNVIVGQSGGPTAVINSSLAGVYQIARERGAGKIYGMLNGIQGLLEGKYVNLKRHIKSQLDIELLKRTPSSFLGSCRYKLPEYDAQPEIYEQIFRFLEEKEIRYFFYIGGNDSMDTIKKLSDYAALQQSPIRFMGIPKTIDNDLDITDHTPGYGSAAKYIGSITKEIIRDSLVYDQDSVTILEIMGRNAGWLTAAAALAAGEDCEGPDMIYLPERIFSLEGFAEKIRERQKDKRSLVVAVSEGIRCADGRYICELGAGVGRTDVFGHRYLSGTGNYLAQYLSENIGCKTRAIEFSTLQRCSSHIASRVDITEAFQAGGAAVKDAFEGHTGEMVILKRISDDPYICVTGTHDIHQIANVEKKVPDNWISPSGDQVERRLVSYIRPLIQAELTPIMSDGLPRHLTLSDH